MTALYPDVTPEEAREATGWKLRLADELRPVQPPSVEELEALRALKPANEETVAR